MSFLAEISLRTINMRVAFFIILLTCQSKGAKYGHVGELSVVQEGLPAHVFLVVHLDAMGLARALVRLSEL